MRELRGHPRPVAFSNKTQGAVGGSGPRLSLHSSLSAASGDAVSDSYRLVSLAIFGMPIIICSSYFIAPIIASVCIVATTNYEVAMHNATTTNSPRCIHKKG